MKLSVEEASPVIPLRSDSHRPTASAEVNRDSPRGGPSAAEVSPAIVVTNVVGEVAGPASEAGLQPFPVDGAGMVGLGLEPATLKVAEVPVANEPATAAKPAEEVEATLKLDAAPIETDHAAPELEVQSAEADDEAELEAETSADEAELAELEVEAVELLAAEDDDGDDWMLEEVTPATAPVQAEAEPWDPRPGVPPALLLPWPAWLALQRQRRRLGLVTFGYWV